MEARKKVIGENHPHTLITMSNLAISYRAQGRLEETRKLEEKILELRVEILGPEHPETLYTQWCLAVSYEKDGRLVGAIELLGETVDAQKRVMGEQHPLTIAMATSLEQMSKEAQDGNYTFKF